MRAIYFELDDEDIFQAQGYAVKDLTEGISTYGHEGLMYLDRIRGFSELLFDKVAGQHFELDEETRQKFSDSVYRSTWHGIAEWWNLRQWAGLLYEDGHSNYDLIDFPELIKNIQEEVTRREPNAKVEIFNQLNVSNIRISYRIANAIALLATDFPSQFGQEINLIITLIDDLIHFELSRKLIYPQGTLDIKKLIDSNNKMPFGTANIIITQHRGHIDVRIEDDRGIFSIDLPKLISNSES